MTDPTPLRWQPDPTDVGELIEHFHADGDAYARRHTHRLPYATRAHVHGTHADEVVDVIVTPGTLRGDSLTMTRSQDGSVRARVKATTYLDGILVDVLGQIADNPQVLDSLPDDPTEAAEWIRQTFAPLDTIVLHVESPQALVRALTHIVPGVTL